MTKAALEASLATLDTLIQVFAVLVAIGIVGEVGFGVRHWVLNRQLHIVQHAEDLNQQEEIARLNKEAGDARKDAGAAVERAGKAEENLAGANERAATANERAALAEQHAAEANKKAEDERIARLKLETQLAPRRVSTEQEKILKGQLLRLTNWEITIFVIMGNPETADFAADLERAFRNAGLKVTTSPGMTFGGTQRGLQATVGKTRMHDLDVLATALRAAGLTTDPLPVQMNDATPDMLQLTVAPK